jgi:hypothetical protein
MSDPYPGERTIRLDAERETERDVTQASVGQLISEVTSDLSTLMRQELDLAKAEVKTEVAKAGKGAGMLGGAGYAGHLTVLFVSLTLMWALGDLFDHLAWGALVVALIWGIAAAVLYVKGREQLKRVNPKPEQTVETLKEDVQWAKNRTR